MRDFYDETAVVEGLRTLDDDGLLLRLGTVERDAEACRPGVRDVVTAEGARRGFSVTWAAARPQPAEPAPAPRDVERREPMDSSHVDQAAALLTRATVASAGRWSESPTGWRTWCRLCGLSTLQPHRWSRS
jgi:hypothetical protein